MHAKAEAELLAANGAVELLPTGQHKGQPHDLSSYCNHNWNTNPCIALAQTALTRTRPGCNINEGGRSTDHDEAPDAGPVGEDGPITGNRP